MSPFCAIFCGRGWAGLAAPRECRVRAGAAHSEGDSMLLWVRGWGVPLQPSLLAPAHPAYPNFPLFFFAFFSPALKAPTAAAVCRGGAFSSCRERDCRVR